MTGKPALNPKLGEILRETMIQDSHRGAQANWRAVMKEHFGDRFDAPRPGAEDMIQVDSPTTINHHHPPAEVAKGLSTLAKIGVAFAVGGPIGAGIAAIPVIQSLLNRPAMVSPAVPRGNSSTLYDLRLGGAEKGAAKP